MRKPGCVRVHPRWSVGRAVLDVRARHRWTAGPGGPKAGARADTGSPGRTGKRAMTRVELTDGNGGPEERNHRETLAVSLIESLGFEGAIHACRANSWDGVLQYVLSLRGAAGAEGI